MVDFTNCKEEFNFYSGSEKKKTLIYNGNKYLVKFPDPIREKNKDISYINNVYSEYVGSHIFELCGFSVQETILGKYNYNGKEKIVCACKDFTDDHTFLLEFQNYVLSSDLDKKIGTELSDIIGILDKEIYNMDYKSIKDSFYNMFIIDFLIGNTDRHNGNWGFLMNDKGNSIFSPIYDCGSCLNPLLEDVDLEKMDDIEIKNLALNTFSVLKKNDKKIHYVSYLSNNENIDVCNALNRVFPKININIIKDFIDNIEGMSVVRKNFYKKVIEIRYSVLERIYNK